ncbi:MAG: ABC transporter permease [Rhodothermales bacterium]
MSAYRFDLENALAAWRRSLTFNPAFSADDLDELEQHLRDQVASLVDGGLALEPAYRQALREMGDHVTAETEYRKVYWGKRRRRGELIHELTWRATMFRNYVKLAWRNVLREKGYAFINVFGLAVGIAFCVLIFLFVRDELTYDRFHRLGDRIYRVQDAAIQPDGRMDDGSIELPSVLGPTLQADIPEVEQFVRIERRTAYTRPAGATNDAVDEPILFADAPFFEVFSFPLVAGDPAGVLADPGNVVITASIARRYFGDTDPMGRTLQIRLDETYEDFVITGVARDVPGNSTIQFGIVLPFETLATFSEMYRELATDWHFFSPETYVLLHAGADRAAVEAKLPAFYATYHQEDIARMKAQGRLEEGVVQTYRLRPIADVHLTDASDPVYSYILSSIALAVLLIACINFTTLSIGRSTRRAREIGLRKVVGARRGQLIAQFWGEALLLSVAALVCGLALAAAFLPTFNDLAGKTLEIDLIANGTTAAMLVGLVLLTGLVAGSYPALVLSGFQPIETLTNRLRLSGSNGLTKGLVALQFALSMFLIASTTIMARQLAYTRSLALGFDREQIVILPLEGLDGEQVADRFRNALAGEPRIVGVTATGNMLGQTGTMGTAFQHKGKRHVLNVFKVEPNFVDFLGLELVAGRNFDARRGADAGASILVNEALVRDFDLADPIGQPIPGAPGDDPEGGPRIVGVVRDFHHQSLYKPVGPMVMTLDPSWGYQYVLVRIAPSDIPESMALLRRTWENVAPDIPFAYRFLDDEMEAQYQEDRRWGQIVRYSAFFAVFIASLGLLGLAALSVTRRTKEIGIRKVIGASIAQLVMLLSREFAVLVGAGILLATPAVYLVMAHWLSDFAYRIELSWWLFAVTALAALGLALTLVGLQAMRAALADPVESLRYE